MNAMTPLPAVKDMLGRQALVAVDAAKALLLAHLANCRPATERIPLAEALHRILAVAIIAAEDLPAHPRSVMDGYALRAADTFGAGESMPAYLQIKGSIAMGEMPTQVVSPGSCLAIATGGLMPEGSDAVVMLEHTVPVDAEMVEVVKAVGVGSNLIAVGDDIRCGEEALPLGHRLRPQDLGLLAGLGLNEVEVYRQVRVAVLSTGDEIVPHTTTPPPGKIRNINAIALAGQIRLQGAVVRDYGIVADQREILLPLLEQASRENDMVIFSGGSSVGIRDLGEEAIDHLGPPGILVHGVALRPGKPIIIGLSGTKPIFGLPGHPVSAMVCCDLFVIPAIKALSGQRTEDDIPAPSLSARLDRNVNSAPGRRDVVRVRLYRRDGILMASPVLGKSGAISTLSRAHGYFFIDEPSQGANQDSIIQVFLYP